MVCLRVVSTECGLVFAVGCVAASVALFVSFEVVLIDTLGRLGFLATVWLYAFVAVLWIETVIHVATEIVTAVKPRAGANEHVSAKPFWSVIARRCTVVRSDVIVAVRTFRGYTDLDLDLSLRLRYGCREATSNNCNCHQKSKCTHNFTP